MIYYLVTSRHYYTLRDYLLAWRKDLALKVRIVPYSALPANLDMPRGAYVFSDLERLKPQQRAVAAGFREALAAAGDGVRFYNHPARSLRRYELLSSLHERGVNRFNAFRPTASGQPWRYPVFIREEREHTGSLTTLLEDKEQVRLELLKLLLDGFELRDLLVVEFCNTADAEGIYRKYAAFRVGDRILPRHVLFSRKWVLKDLDLLEPAQREEVRHYCRTNPHEMQLRAIFESAAIEYGRIDYAMLDGAIQVWEINTNPLVMRAPDQYPPESLPFHEAFAKSFGDAFAELNLEPSSAPRIPISWDGSLLWGT